MVRRSMMRRRSLAQRQALPPSRPYATSLSSAPSSACAQHRLNSSQSRIPRRSSSHGVRPMAAPENSASDPWWRSGAPPTHVAGTSGSSASDPWRRTRSRAPLSYGRRAQEWRCRRRGVEEEWRRVALPPRVRRRGPVTGVEAGVDNRFRDATRREGFYFCNASLLRSILKLTFA
jgi:hypothetical protein